MNTRNENEDAMDEFAQLWRSQDAGRPDISRLRREAARARRREIALSVLEIGLLVAAVAVVGHFAAGSASLRAAAVATAMLVLAAAFTGWSLWNRRVALRSAGLAPHTLVDAEMARAQAARRFWRVNTGVMLALAALVIALGLAQSAGVVGGLRPERWWLAMLGNGPLILFSLLWARRRDRQLRGRLESLEALRRQFDD